MKLRNILLSLLLCATAASAQDIITKTDGTTIDAKVEEITETAIRYHKASNPTGPVYTIALTNVASITYENGSVDNFNTAAIRPENTTPTASPSDDELMRYAATMTSNTTASNNYNDAQLLRMNKSYDYVSEEILSKAKKKRIIGWAGGGAIIAAGLISAYLISPDDVGASGSVAVACCSVAAAAGWCLGFNLSANSLIKKAKNTEVFSAAIINNEILNVDGKSLTAGVNVMGNRMTNTRGLGLALTFNF